MHRGGNIPGGVIASTPNRCCHRCTARILPLRPLLRLPSVPRAERILRIGFLLRAADTMPYNRYHSNFYASESSTLNLDDLGRAGGKPSRTINRTVVLWPDHGSRQTAAIAARWHECRISLARA